MKSPQTPWTSQSSGSAVAGASASVVRCTSSKTQKCNNQGTSTNREKREPLKQIGNSDPRVLKTKRPQRLIKGPSSPSEVSTSSVSWKQASGMRHCTCTYKICMRMLYTSHTISISYHQMNAISFTALLVFKRRGKCGSNKSILSALLR